LQRTTKLSSKIAEVAVARLLPLSPDLLFFIAITVRVISATALQTAKATSRALQPHVQQHSTKVFGRA
jgi:hypothetical protein